MDVYFSGRKSDENISEKRKEAWNMIRDSIDKGLPCYAWEMDKPLYYLIAGYDDTGYYYIEHDSREIAGPKPYNELCDTEWGILETHIIRPGSISDSLKIVKDIFEYAINVSNPDHYLPNPGYTMGVNAYEIWWEALLNETADYYGVAYNAVFWAKCKLLAVLFLQESKLRIEIEERLFNHAISCYQNAANLLSQLSKLFPLNKTTCEIGENQKNDAVNLLKLAYKNEMDGLTSISNILDKIYKIW
jgi:hypothetical protein